MAKIKGTIKPSDVDETVKTFNPPIDIPEAEPAEEKEKVLVRCPDCPWKAGLKDENTYCGTCNGTGQVPADPLE